MRRVLVGGLLGLALLAAATPAAAQVALPRGVRPGERAPELPELEAPQPAPEIVLPPVPEVPLQERGRLSAAPRVFVREVRITGSSVFTKEELARVVEPWTSREITTEDLQAARDALTLHYVEHGYVTSGAVLPDQKVEDGVIELRVVEGELGGIEVSGNRHFRSSYFEKRLALAAGKPVNVNALEKRLQLFQQDPRIRRLHAQLAPGTRLGESLLRLDVEESRPYHLGVAFDNHEPPSIGSLQGMTQLSHESLSGNGDTLELQYQLTGGLDDEYLSYELPLNAWDSTLELHFERSDSEVVESPFDALDIESETETYGIRLSHPAYRTPSTLLSFFATGEYRESRSYLLGERFDFSEVLGDDAEAVVSVLRLGNEWTRRTPSQVLAARSTVSWGLPVLGATENRGDLPGGQFVSWLGQLQWARRFDPSGIELVARTDIQIASRALLPLEQLALGGSSTVRGYRENQIVRDMGAIASIELRIPIWQTSDGLTRIQLAPFFDIGRGWNHASRATPSPRMIAAPGIGLRGALTRLLRYELYWGQKLRDVEDPAHHDLQDDGLHFQIFAAVF